MKGEQLDNYLVTLAKIVQKLGVPLREDGWPPYVKGSAVAFHLGRFIYHAARTSKALFVGCGDGSR